MGTIAHVQIGLLEKIINSYTPWGMLSSIWFGLGLSGFAFFLSTHDLVIDWRVPLPKRSAVSREEIQRHGGCRATSINASAHGILQAYDHASLRYGLINHSRVHAQIS